MAVPGGGSVYQTMSRVTCLGTVSMRSEKAPPSMPSLLPSNTLLGILHSAGPDHSSFPRLTQKCPASGYYALEHLLPLLLILSKSVAPPSLSFITFKAKAHLFYKKELLPSLHSGSLKSGLDFSQDLKPVLPCVRGIVLFHVPN